MSEHDVRGLLQLCHETLARPASERERFLDEACAGDPDLRRAVDALLAEQSATGGFLQAPAWTPERPRLAAGTRLGPYEIEALIGAGGMGEVYKARDTRLGRTVAIKVLPPDVAADPDRRRRFEQEARAVSALNHPNICTLHDIGSAPVGSGLPFDSAQARQPGTTCDYLVMEYLDGQTLAERLTKGPMVLAQALECATQIADALAKAHRQGIVHRDLKPGNVMLTKSGVKLLDFGLARLTHAPSGTAASVTISATGTVAGTVPYMAPEQLQGLETDARTDLFAFGAVLYEMLTGKRAFEGESAASVTAAILEHEPPPLSSLQPLTPSALDRLIRKCLAKDPDARWQSASDVADELRWIAQNPASPDDAEGSPRRVRSLTRWIAGLFMVVLGSTLAWVAWRAWLGPAGAAHSVASTPSRLSHRLTLVLSPDAPLASIAAMPLAGDKPALALSPDGRLLIYSAETGGRLHLSACDITTGSTTPLPGTDGGHTPFFSPDGTRVGFFANGKLRTTALAGGTPMALADVSNPWGGAWGVDGVIFFNRRDGEGLFKIDPAVGRVQPVFSEGTMPRPLSPGDGLLAYIGARTVWIKNGRLEKRLVKGFGLRYVPTGHLLYALPGQLMAVPFDRDRVTVTGPPVVLAGDLRTAPYGVAQFTVSDEGTLVYVPGRDQRVAVFVRRDRDGRMHPLGIPEGAYGPFSLSPDGARLAVQVEDDTAETGTEVWIYDLARGTRSRIGGSVPKPPATRHTYPKWAPDGRHLVYCSTSGAQSALVWSSADGSENAVLWSSSTKGPKWLYPMSFSPDGTLLSAFGSSDETGYDLYTMRIRTVEGSIVKEVEPRVFLKTPAAEGFGQFSRDGRAMAYDSDASGQAEVYVAGFPEPGSPCQVSRGGGMDPSWTPDGQGIVYQSGTTFYAVEVRSVSECRVGVPRRLFEGAFPDRPGFGHDMQADGRLVMLETKEYARPAATLKVMTNFFDELRRRVPSRSSER